MIDLNIFNCITIIIMMMMVMIIIIIFKKKVRFEAFSVLKHHPKNHLHLSCNDLDGGADVTFTSQSLGGSGGPE